MSALRVLHVTPYFENAWAYGGIPRVVSAQAHALAAAGLHVTVVTTDARDAASRTTKADGELGSRFAPRAERTADGIDVRVFPNISNVLAYRWQFYTPAGLARHLRGHALDFDVAHLHACHNLLTALAAKELRRAGVPYVVQPNGTTRRIERRRTAKRIFDALFERDMLQRASRLIAVTQWERRQLEQVVPAQAGVGWSFSPAQADLKVRPTDPRESNVRVVPNPLAPMPPCPLPERGGFRQRYSLTDAPLVMYLGMLSPRKHPELLALAVAGLNRKDVQLVFAGNDMGAARRTRETVRRLGLEPRARFTGLITGSARYAALAAADIVVYPSRDEVFGLVPLEALQAGTPVIVSNDAGCGEIFGTVGGGLLVPPGDPRALAAAIDAVLCDLPRWRVEAAQAGTEASRRFHPDAVAAQLEEVYCEAIARPDTP
jgi:glycosyltransferase involved in cell wall biosynthesis